MSKSHHEISHLSSCMYHILCVLGLTFLLSSCHGVSDKTRFMGCLHWLETKEVIATADSLMNLQYITTLTYHKIWVKSITPAIRISTMLRARELINAINNSPYCKCYKETTFWTDLEL